MMMNHHWWQHHETQRDIKFAQQGLALPEGPLEEPPITEHSSSGAVGSV